MKRKTLIVISTILIICLSIVSSTALAQDEKDNRKKVDIEKFPELTCNKYGVIEADNLLDPNSPNYDPSLRYGLEGTRFGPPGKQNLDFYRKLGIDVDQYNYLEKDRKKSDPLPGDISWGTVIDDDNSVEAVQAYQKIHTSLTLNGNSWKYLYAPTLMAPDYCRLEIVVRYKHHNGVTERHLAVFTHGTAGGGSFTNIYSLDQGAFQYRYVNGADEVIIRIEKTGSDNNPTWKACLYDLVDHEWDEIASVTGKSILNKGWDAWEEIQLGNPPGWPTLPEITSRYLIVEVNGTPYFVTSTYGDEYLDGTFPDEEYEREMIEDYYEWSVSS